ncbi:MAG: histidine kinase N-terminal 7TM domain-containing protein [Ruminococcus sp.]|nr:histidine kinase N-terminal 7TM domain-containing protein [Ruminococcus sp.]
MPLIPTTLSLLGLLGMTGTVIWVLVRGNGNRLTRLFVICQVAVMIWLVSQLMKLFSANTEQLWLSYVVGNVGICMFGPSWMMFAAEYSDYRAYLRKPSYLLPLISVFFFISVITNPVHYMYYSVFEYGNVVCGRLYYLSQITYYVLILGGICLMFIKHSQSSRRMTSQSVLIALAIAVPLCINTLTVCGIIKTAFELTPLFFAFSVVMILIAISRFGLLNVNRIAIDDTIDSIDSAVLVFDADDIMTYKNRYADTLFSAGTGATLGEFLAEVKAKTGTEPDRDMTSCELTCEGAFYNIRQNFCTNKKGERIARIIILNNVSEYYELLDTEKKLSLEQERNRIAQEIHDSAGHTFTMISSLSRIIDADLAGRNVPAETVGYVREIDGLSRSGVTQLRCSINNLRSDEFMTSVTRAISTVTAAVRGIDIDVCTKGEEDESFAFCIGTVYENTRETITNAMRYSGAERIDIIVKFLPDMLELYIFDNGRGCSEISENNGLRGIRERTEALGGTVKFSSEEGEGFTTIIKIPKQNTGEAT